MAPDICNDNLVSEDSNKNESMYVGTEGTNSDASDRLWLDGKDSIPSDW